jgi:hypothetical protein
MTDAELAMARSRARQAVTRLIAGTRLHFQLYAYELVVINPRELSTGTLHVDYASGLVSWERTVWDDLGYLPGYTISAAGFGYIGPDMVRNALNAPPQRIRGV